MLLTNHAQKLYRGIEALGGGVIREQVLRAKAGGISHGTFIAARQELCKAGFLAIERTARKPHYRLMTRSARQRSSRSRRPSTRRARSPSSRQRRKSRPPGQRHRRRAR